MMMENGLFFELGVPQQISVKTTSPGSDTRRPTLSAVEGDCDMRATRFAVVSVLSVLCSWFLAAILVAAQPSAPQPNIYLYRSR